MRREGKACVRISKEEYDDLLGYEKRYFNNIIATNRTLRGLYFCPQGKSKCTYCSDRKRSGKFKSRVLKKNLRNELKQINDHTIYRL